MEIKYWNSSRHTPFSCRFHTANEPYSHWQYMVPSSESKTNVTVFPQHQYANGNLLPGHMAIMHGGAWRTQTSRKVKRAEVWKVALFPPTIFTIFTQTVNTYISSHFFFSMIFCIKSWQKKSFFPLKAHYLIHYLHVDPVDTPIMFNIMFTVSPRWWGGRSRSTIGTKGFQSVWQGPMWRLAQLTCKAAAFMGCYASAAVNWGRGHG